MTKIIVQEPTRPSLLLSPDESRDRNGPVTLTESGAVRRVPFDGGQAFFVEEGTTNLIPNPSFEINANGWVSAGVGGATVARDTTQSIDGTASLRVDVDGTISGQGTMMAPSPVEIPPSTTYTLSAFVKAPAGLGLELGGNVWNGVAWVENFSVKSFVGTGSWERIVNTRTLASPPLYTIRPFVRTSSTGSATTFWVDGVQLEAKPYATPFTHGDMGDGYSWTGTPHNSTSTRDAASIAAPLDAFSTAYIRHDGGSTVLTEPGTFGDHGLLTLDNGTLTVSTDQETTIAALVLYDIPLTEAEITRLDSIPTSELTWANASLIERMVDVEVETIFPDYRSSIYAIESELFITDRENKNGIDVSNAITDIEVDMDIDRFGGKSRCVIQAYSPVIHDGDWVSPYLTVTPEVGESTRSQMGHYFLDAPNVTYDGTGAENMTITGVDHVQLLADSSLLETFYTPVNGNVMGDIELAIRMLGITSMGPNLLTNGSFENEGSDWVGPAWTSGGTGSFSFPDYYSVGIPDGNKFFAVVFSSGNPQNGTGYIRTGDIPIPQGTNKLLMSGLHYVSSGTRMYISMRFHDSAGAMIGSFVTSPSGTPSPSGRWNRVMRVVDVPENASYVRLWIFALDQIGGRVNQASWDDIQLRAVTGDLLPESVLALPENSTRASNRIQHTIEDSLYTAINDRLAGIAHQAIQVDNKGLFTTRPYRDLESDEPKRRYIIGGDSEVVGDISIQRSTNNRYNRVVVTKESYEGEDMWSIATNDDPNDKWSVRNSPVRTQYVSAQEAVDQESLDILAQQFLSRASMQEDLHLTVLPDPEITAYDNIRVEGEGAPDALGNWSLESVKWGMTAENPLVRLGARRTIRSGRDVS